MQIKVKYKTKNERRYNKPTWPCCLICNKSYMKGDNYQLMCSFDNEHCSERGHCDEFSDEKGEKV
jgi:hypothetical protein